MVKYKTADSHDWTCDKAPSECPLCHHAIDPRYLTGVTREYQPMGDTSIELVFQCPRQACLHVFIGRYEGRYDRNVNRATLFLRATTPYTVPLPEHPPEVAAISPDFVAIYGEAAVAEERGLKQVAGCGYRKALEFLVKDFCIREHPTEAEEIKKGRLGNVIEKWIDDPNIKGMAKRATWLGNDETHYVRKWDDPDMAKLKQLIALTVSWINTHQLTKKFAQDMPE
jgi:hypothetical protein